MFCFWSLFTGLSFQDFYQRCREAFLVNSDLTLRTQLTEFRDHKLIRTRKVESCFHMRIPSSHSSASSVTLSYLFPWFYRARMEWSICWLLWMQTHWWTSWRMKRVTENCGAAMISWLLNLPMERKMSVIFHAGMSNICWFWLLNSKQEKRGRRLVTYTSLTDATKKINILVKTVTDGQHQHSSNDST